METWKDVPDTDYSVSNMGRVASRKFGKWRVLRPGKAACGYLVLAFCEGNVIRAKLVHRLIAAAFVGPAPTPKHQVNHKDGDTLNNRPDNLEWVTASRNKLHALDVLGQRAEHAAKGIIKLSEAQVREIRAMGASEETQKAIAQKYGISESHVSKIVNGKTWAWLA